MTHDATSKSTPHIFLSNVGQSNCVSSKKAMPNTPKRRVHGGSASTDPEKLLRDLEVSMIAYHLLNQRLSVYMYCLRNSMPINRRLNFD